MTWNAIATRSGRPQARPGRAPAPDGRTAERAARLALGAVLAVQLVFVVLNVRAPGWVLVDLDQEYNLPTWFHSGLLGAAALVALDILRLEWRLLGVAGRRRAWALGWPGVAALFAYLALDESLAIHEGFLTRELEGWLAPASPLQLTLAWLLVFLPGIVAAVTFLLASLGARARLCPRLVAWGSSGLALWLLALTLEGTARSFFIPRGLYELEVILEETAESVGTTLFLWAFWRYRAELDRGLARAGTAGAPSFAVPWRWVLAGTLALVVPAGVVTGSIAWSPHVLQKSVGDRHLRAGRLEDAAQAYRAAVDLRPGYATAWDRLGIAEFRRGDLEAAERAFTTAERLDPRAATPLNHRGAVLLRQRRAADAATAFARAVALDPRDAELHRNLGIALRRLGREADAEAAFRRAEALGLGRFGVTTLRVSLPADLPLVYLADPRLDPALALTRAGRVDLAVAEYRRALDGAPDLAAAHLGLANELLRGAVARRLTRDRPPVRVADADGDPVRPSVLFTHGVRHPDGRWEAIEATVEPDDEARDTALRAEARQHYARALALGAGPPARVGLALLDRDAAAPPRTR